MLVLLGGIKLARKCGSRNVMVRAFSELEGMTPLMGAATLGKRSVAQALLARGADASLRSSNGLTAAEWAELAGQPAEFVADLQPGPRGSPTVVAAPCRAR